MAAPLFGIDVSAHQGSINWPQVKPAGLTFAVARCVRESGGVDVQFAANVAGAKKIGLIPGAYVFLVGGTAKRQAKTFIDAVGNPSGMLIMIDVERPTNRKLKVPTFADVAAFVHEWRAAHPKHPLLIYGSAGSVLGQVGRQGALHAFGRLWLAHYRDGHGTTAPAFYASIGGNEANQWRTSFSGFARPSIWQFTSHQVHIPGIAKSDPKKGLIPRAVDINAYRGTREQLLVIAGIGTLAKPAAASAAAASAPTPTPAKKASSGKVFHVVKSGETLSGIAKRFGFKGFRALIAMFPENKQFAANPGLIHAGQKVRVD